jgi:hypothetical protein
MSNRLHVRLFVNPGSLTELKQKLEEKNFPFFQAAADPFLTVELEVAKGNLQSTLNQITELEKCGYLVRTETDVLLTDDTSHSSTDNVTKTSRDDTNETGNAATQQDKKEPIGYRLTFFRCAPRQKPMQPPSDGRIYHVWGSMDYLYISEINLLDSLRPSNNKNILHAFFPAQIFHQINIFFNNSRIEPQQLQGPLLGVIAIKFRPSISNPQETLQNGLEKFNTKTRFYRSLGLEDLVLIYRDTSIHSGTVGFSHILAYLHTTQNFVSSVTSYLCTAIEDNQHKSV